MRKLAMILWAGLLLGLLLLVGTVTAEVVWTDEVDDAEGDVKDDSGNPLSGRPEADILSVSMAEEGANINLTLVLAGAYDGTGGMYTIYMEADGGDSYQFSKIMSMSFMGTGPDMGAIPVDGYISGDGTTLSWVVAKADIDATSKFEIDFATATSTTGATALDSAGTGGGSGDEFAPSSVVYEVKFTSLHVMKMTATMVFEGQGAATLRDWLDSDDDGTITAAEVSAFEDLMTDDDPELNMTLDGKGPTTVLASVEIQGAEGATQPTKTTTIVATNTATFPEPADADTHTYAWPEGDDDNFPGSGDEWGDADVSFKIVCPDGWKFKTDGWPAALKDYLEDDGTEIVMSASEFKANADSTLGQLDDMVLEKSSSGGGDGDDEPGFGIVAVLAATAVAAVAVRRRR